MPIFRKKIATNQYLFLYTWTENEKIICLNNFIPLGKLYLHWQESKKILLLYNFLPMGTKKIK
jgi:hypothetical protein